MFGVWQKLSYGREFRIGKYSDFLMGFGDVLMMRIILKNLDFIEWLDVWILVGFEH